MITGNTASGSGGGLSVQAGGAAGADSLMISGCTISGNTAGTGNISGGGGGIYYHGD